MQARATAKWRPQKGEEKIKKGVGSVGLVTDVRSELEDNQRARDVLYTTH